MLLAGSAVEVGLETVQAEDFYNPAHAHIFAAIGRLYGDGQPVDPVTVASELRGAQLLDAIGGPSVLISLQANTPATSNAGRYAGTVRENALLRRVILAGAEISELGYEGDLERATAALERTQDILSSSGTGITFEDVGAVLRGDVADIMPELLEREDNTALIYPGLTHWLMGEPGKGKTFIALEAVRQAITDGRDVMFLDWEGNRRIIGSRLRSLQLTAELVDSHLLYLRPSVITRAKGNTLASIVRDRRVALVICDGVAKALAQQGLNEDKAPEVLAWLNLVANPLADAGAAVLMLDHVTKDREGRGLWARGSGAKLGEVSGAAWSVKSKEPFSRQKAGQVDLIQAKDREGYTGSDGDVVATFTFTPTNNGEHLQIVVSAPTQRESDEEWLPTGVMETLSKLVQATGPLGKRAVYAATKARKETVDVAIGGLVKGGYIRTQKDGVTLNHYHVRPFTEAEHSTESAATSDEEF